MMRKRIIDISPAEYFMEALENSASNQGYDNKFTLSYVLNSLVSYMQDPSSPPTFAVEFLKAAGVEGERKRIALKRLGDSSLFWAGLFQERLMRSGLPLDYFRGMGIGAYDALGEEFKERGLHFGDIYSQLADDFICITDILTEMRDRMNMNSDKGLLNLYQRWIRNESPHLERLLREKGIIPLKPGYS